MRRSAFIAVLLGLCWPGSTSAASRILYASNWSGAMEIYAVDPSGKAPAAQLTFGGDLRRCEVYWTPCGFVDPMPSPNGRNLLYRHLDGSLWLARADGSSPHELPGARGRPDWSHDSRWVAYSTNDAIHVVRVNGGIDRGVWRDLGGDVDIFWAADGKGLFVRAGTDLYEIRNDRTRLVTTSVVGNLVPSPNRLSLVTTQPGQMSVLIDLRARPIARVPLVDKAVAAAWSKDGRHVALISPIGLSLYDVRKRRMRLLASASEVGYRYEQTIGVAAMGLAWSPDGKSVAYIPGGTNPQFSGGIQSGDLRTVSLSGRRRTIVSTEHALGGRMLSLAWTPAVRGLTYHRPEETTTNRASADSVLTERGVSDLASDGQHLAYTSCNGVFVWTSRTSQLETVVQRDPPSACFFRTNFVIYAVAVGGNRVAYAESSGCNVITQTLFFKRFDVAEPPRPIATGNGNCGAPFHPFVGDLVGDRDVLAFSAWQERSEYPRFFTTQQSIFRVGAEGCPCPIIASGGGPLIPADADGGRIIAFGDRATLLLDREGKVLYSIPVSPVAAQLAGNDLILLFRGQLRQYDARDGSFLRAWPMSDVPSGRGCWWRCPNDELVLQDARRGLVAYVLEAKIHLLRLSDGADAVFAPGRLAQFMDNGLVYVRGSRIRLVPWSSLPLN